MPTSTPPETGLRVRFWGTRGSIPSPGPGTVRFGGNTPCVEVRGAPDVRVVFDAGTGIRLLGSHLAHEAGPVELDLFITHFHWDHVHGFPFFAPLYSADAVVCVHAPAYENESVDEVLATLMSLPYFPLPFDSLGARISYRRVGAEPFVRDGLEVSAFRVQHPGVTYGYRLSAGDVSLAYVPDNELMASDPDLYRGPDWRDAFVRFLEGVDLLIHDAMFTDAEYGARIGWGHSTHGQALRLAADAGVSRLCLFHHAPDRGDIELADIVDRIRAEARRIGADVEVSAAAEGEEVVIEPAPGS